MSSVVISGDTSGAITLDAPTTAGTSTLTLPSGASGTIAAQGVSTNIVSRTAVASTSGTSIDFTSIPSWVKRVTVMFTGFSVSGVTTPLIQIGSGSVTTTGYLGASSNIAGSAATTVYTNGFAIRNTTGASALYNGCVSINLLTGNTWAAFGVLGQSDSGVTTTTAGSVTISGVLDRVRITTVNGTDTIDAGSINILYE